MCVSVCVCRSFTSCPFDVFYVSLLHYYCALVFFLLTHTFLLLFSSSLGLLLLCAFCTASEADSLFDSSTVAPDDTVHVAFRKAYAKIEHGTHSFFSLFESLFLLLREGVRFPLSDDQTVS